MDLEEPTALARLPKPLQAHGDVKFGPVWAIRNGVKRKRLEICSAVDRNSINVYDVQNGKLLDSHPVSPESTFVGPPCSLFWKTGEENRRRTYCALKRDKIRIHCFEAAEKDGRPSVSESSFELPDTGSPVVLLQVCGIAESVTILVLQQNGMLTSLSYNLGQVLASGRLPQDSHTSSRTLAAQLLSSAEAEKSVLKSRADISTAANGNSFYLASVCETQDISSKSSALVPKIWYKLYSLGWLTQEYSTHDRPNQCLLQHLLHDISVGEEKLPWSKRPFLFESRASKLYIKQPQAVVAYDLTTIVPKRTAVLPNKFNNYIDICPVSSSLILSTFPDSLKLCDVHYSAIQARMDLNKTSLKRKRTRTGEDPRSGPIELIGYFPRLNRCLARRKNHILAIGLRTFASAQNSSGTIQKPLLIDSIGLGAGDRELKQGNSRIKEKTNIGQVDSLWGSSVKWQQTRKQLDQLFQNGDIDRFEQIFFQNIDESVQSVSGAKGQSLTNLNLANHFPTAIVDYVFSKLFKIEPESFEASEASTKVQHSLKLCFPARKLLTWLGRAGALTKQRLHKVLVAPLDPRRVSESLESCHIVEILISGDESLSLLEDFLKTSSDPDVREQAFAVKILVDRAINESAERTSTCSGAIGTDPETDQALNIGTFDTTIITFDANASRQSDLPSPALARTLGLALKILGANPSKTISSTIKKSFSRSEILGLIQFLRQQLFLGGATRFTLSQDHLNSASNTENGISESQERGKSYVTDKLELDIIVKVLSNCVDAVGPQGLLGSGVDDDNFAASIVSDLQSEVNRTLQSVEDALELRGILRETLRYVESVPKHLQVKSKEPTRQNTNMLTTEPGAIATLFAEGSLYGSDSKASTILPISLRSHIVNPLMMRAGGQVSKRSVRNTHLLESRLKGPYAFERLTM